MKGGAPVFSFADVCLAVIAVCMVIVVLAGTNAI